MWSYYSISQVEKITVEDVTGGRTEYWQLLEDDSVNSWWALTCQASQQPLALLFSPPYMSELIKLPPCTFLHILLWHLFFRLNMQTLIDRDPCQNTPRSGTRTDTCELTRTQADTLFHCQWSLAFTFSARTIGSEDGKTGGEAPERRRKREGGKNGALHHAVTKVQL